MTPALNTIDQLNPSKDEWTIVVRVIRAWYGAVMDKSGLPHSYNLYLMDSKGDKIHAFIKKTNVYRFEKIIKEGGVYSIRDFNVGHTSGDFRPSNNQFKINIKFETKVIPVSGEKVPLNLFKFDNLDDVLTPNFDANILVDVIGTLTGVGTEVDFIRNGVPNKRNQIEILAHGHHVKCILFGNYVDELNSFLAAGNISNVVVIFNLAKLRNFQGEFQLQNAYNCSKLMFNPDHPAVNIYRMSIAANSDTSSQSLSQIADPVRPSEEDEFLKLHPRATINFLNEHKTRNIFIVFGLVDDIVNPLDWFYNACKCNKSVYSDGKFFFCDNCNKHVVNPTPRYKLRLNVTDDTGSAKFVLFDRDGTSVTMKTCKEVLESAAKSGDTLSMPEEIRELLHKQFLFKVETKEDHGSMFEPSFTVKKVCKDADIIMKFISTENAASEQAHPTLKTPSETPDSASITNHSIADLVTPTSLPQITGFVDTSVVVSSQENVKEGVTHASVIANMNEAPKDGKVVVDKVHAVDLGDTQTSFATPASYSIPIIDVDSLTPAKRRSDVGNGTDVSGSSNAKILKAVKIEKK